MSPRRLFTVLTALLLGCSRTPQHDFDAGVAYFKAEKFAKAEGCFARAVAGSSPTAQAFNFLGVCQIEVGNTNAAIQSFQEALKLDSGHTAARQNLALVFLEVDKPDDAIPLFRQLPGPQPDLGLAYLQAGAWSQARQVLAKCGDSAEILNALGVANAHLGNYREAKSEFEKCLAASPDFAAAALNLAIVEHRHLGDKAAALKHYQRYLELEPKRDDVQAVATQLEQELAPKPKTVEPPVPATPKSPPEPVKSAPVVEQPAPPKPEPAPVVAPTPAPPPPPAVKRRTPTATQILTPGNRSKAQQLFTEGIALQQQGKLPSAIAIYSKAVAADPTFANGYYNLAIAYRDLHQPERALDNYERALQADPKFTNARINYAILLQQEGYIVDALAQYEQVLKENPNDASIQLTAGNLYARDRATFDKARQHFQAYLKLAPSAPPARDVRRWLEQNP
jgi:tetratricopeptide (TPR) repeat protein